MKKSWSWDRIFVVSAGVFGFVLGLLSFFDVGLDSESMMKVILTATGVQLTALGALSGIRDKDMEELRRELGAAKITRFEMHKAFPLEIEKCARR